MRENQAGKTYIRPSFAVAALAVVFVLHFVFTQFVALQSENEAVLSEIINQKPAGAESVAQDETKMPDAVAGSPDGAQVSAPEAVKAENTGEAANDNSRIIRARQQVVVKQPQAVAPAAKKKEPRADFKSERLRRAEKILTGI